MALLSFIKNLVSEKEGVKKYREKLAQFLSDSNLSDEEKQEIESISKKFALPPVKLENCKNLLCLVFFKISLPIKELRKKNANHWRFCLTILGFRQRI